MTTLMCFVNVYAQITTDNKDTNVYRYLSVTLQTTDIAYALNGDKIFNLLIENISDTTQTISLSDDYVHNIVIHLFNESNIEMPTRNSTVSRRNNSKIAYKVFVLPPKERFQIQINLNDYVKVVTPGIYRLYTQYYPNFYADLGTPKDYVESNSLIISVVNIDKNVIRDENKMDTQELLNIRTQEKLHPDEIIKYALEALQKQNWDTFFTFVDIRSLYLNTTVSQQVFATLTPSRQQAELAQFRNLLQRGNSNSDIYAPDSFSIEETEYTQTHGQVTVITKVIENNITIVKRYIFYLQRLFNIWKLVNYDVRIIGNTVNAKSNIFGLENGFIAPDEMRIRN